MKRPSSTGSLVGAGAGGLPCTCPPDEKRVLDRVGSIHSILDGLGEGEEDEMMMTMGEEGRRVGLSPSSAEKKRRLGVDQVKALEKNFEVENKLQPERKARLAQELGLQPRQVAVWFQNRRARWKTKQLERDYGVLKANYDALKSNYDALVHDKERLLAEFKELKSNVGGDGESSHCSVKEEPVVGEEEKLAPTPRKTSITATAATTGGVNGGVEEQDEEDAPALIYKDGSSDSDSSAILNDLSSPSRVASQQNQLLDEFTGFYRTSSPFQCHDGGGNGLGYYYYQAQHQEEDKQTMPKVEETEFQPCSSSFFSDEQERPSSLPWYFPQQWN